MIPVVMSNRTGNHDSYATRRGTIDLANIRKISKTYCPEMLSRVYRHFPLAA